MVEFALLEEQSKKQIVLEYAKTLPKCEAHFLEFYVENHSISRNNLDYLLPLIGIPFRPFYATSFLKAKRHPKNIADIFYAWGQENCSRNVIKMINQNLGKPDEEPFFLVRLAGQVYIINKDQEGHPSLNQIYDLDRNHIDSRTIQQYPIEKVDYSKMYPDFTYIPFSIAQYWNSTPYKEETDELCRKHVLDYLKSKECFTVKEYAKKCCHPLFGLQNLFHSEGTIRMGEEVVITLQAKISIASCLYKKYQMGADISEDADELVRRTPLNTTFGYKRVSDTMMIIPKRKVKKGRN